MHPRQMESGTNMFLIVSLIIAGIAIILSILVFAYAHLLSGQVAQKSAALKQAESSVSEDTVDSFIRLQDRLNQAQTVLNDHVLLSQFLDTLSTLTLTDVRFAALQLTLADDHSASIKMTGTAATFNALAAQSASFATQPLIKQAIFSGITADPATGVVTFTLTATLDPKLVDIPSSVPASWSVAPAGVPAGTSDTQSTTTATTTP